MLAYDQLDRSRANRLLGVGLGGDTRPIDELIAYLSSGIAARWLELALDHGPMKDFGSAREWLFDGRASATQMRAVKDQSKRLLKKAVAPQERLAAMAGYFIAIAASVVHHRIVPSDRPLGDIREVLIDLATALPEPWSEMLGKATLTLDEMMGGSGGEVRGS
jgi:hypothetical protein